MRQRVISSAAEARRLLKADGLSSRLKKLWVPGPHPVGKFFRWALVGLFCTILDTSLFTIIYGATESVLIANLVSTPTVVSTGYILNKVWAFDSDNKKRFEMPKFLATTFAIYVVNSFLVWTWMQFGLTTIAAKILSVPVQAPIMFFLLNVWVFRVLEHQDSLE